MVIMYMKTYVKQSNDTRTSNTAMFSWSCGRTVADDGVHGFIALAAIEARVRFTRHVIWKHINYVQLQG